ncbi:Uncharacterised protein [Klebsiella variicola]|nr:hypothetical protein [Klebsiella variicola]MDR6259178.1 hypothetical protein [Klebsiella sp. SORGH_AS_0826]MDR6346632.1 hypothetical protein [Klebsiella sp. SORGH_AS_1025]MDR6359534.1 hypothetical protein [Klebsiella sp. SORGH_AS_1173]MDR6257337.1 hypothetical protein [Klebsiella variicola]
MSFHSLDKRTINHYVTTIATLYRIEWETAAMMFATLYAGNEEYRREVEFFNSDFD